MARRGRKTIRLVKDSEATDRSWVESDIQAESESEAMEFLEVLKLRDFLMTVLIEPQLVPRLDPLGKRKRHKKGGRPPRKEGSRSAGRANALHTCQTLIYQPTI